MGRLNGWQRLWLLATGAGALWFLVLYPLQASNNNGNSPYHEALLRDFDNGACATYMTRPLASLTEPSYSSDGGTCWFIYTTRTTNKIEDVPFTKEKAERARTVERLQTLGGILMVGAVGLLLFSGSLYGAGALVAWVRRGFKGSVPK